MVLREDPGVCPLFILWHICGAQILTKSQVLDLIGRSGEIRTPDPLLPKQVRYQAALRSDNCGPTMMPSATFAACECPSITRCCRSGNRRRQGRGPLDDPRVTLARALVSVAGHTSGGAPWQGQIWPNRAAHHVLRRSGHRLQAPPNGMAASGSLPAMRARISAARAQSRCICAFNASTPSKAPSLRMKSTKATPISVP